MHYDVILVVSPFAVLNCPLVGPSVLVPQLRKKGISTKLCYANIVLASEIGPTVYDRFTDIDYPGGGMIGEALFSFWTRPGEPGLEHARRQIAEILDIKERTSPTVGAKAVNPEMGQLRHDVALCFEAIPRFLDKVCTDILSHSPEVVGFHTSDPHLTSAIALAKRLKAEAPDLVTVMGGPFATSPMGEAISKACGFFDFVFSGEADYEFPQFVEEFLEKGALPKENVIDCPPVLHLDDVSVPDYDDYFEQMADAFPSEQDGKHLVAGMLFEASRSCWWGVTNPCTFCGLDSPSSPARRKDADRVYEEIHVLTKRYGISKLHTADVAFPKEYYRTLLPKLAASDDNHLDLELNVRPDLPVDDLDTMKQAGITGLLSGIESFSTLVLQKLNKGVTARQNLCLLRDCRSREIQVAYVFLMGVPGEDPEEYRTMTNLIPKIVHLEPPRFLSTVGIMRTSAYFSEPEKYGITNILPSPIYRLIFGDEADLDGIAYSFLGSIPSEFLKDDSLRKEFTATVTTWCNCWRGGEILPVLRKVPVLKGIQAIQDTRGCAVQTFYFPDDEEFELLNYLTTPHRRSDLPVRFEDRLDNLLRRSFIVEHEGFLFSIVTSTDVGSATPV